MNVALEQVIGILKDSYGSRETLLRNLLQSVDGGKLDTWVPIIEASSPTVQLAALFCRWAVARHMPAIAPQGTKILLPSLSLDVVKLANKIGQPHVSKIVIGHVHGLLCSKNITLFDDEWFDFELQAAKSLRLLGEHAEAILVYRRLLESAGNASPYYGPKILLNLGKMSHSYEWRTGLYLQLAKIAEARFRRLKGEEVVDSLELDRQIAICIDCRCQTEFYINDGGEKEAILCRWEEALALCRDVSSGNSYWRIWLRRAYAEFQRSQDIALRRSLVEKYLQGLKEVENRPDERRGLAVRYGQLADMLSELGYVSEAQTYLREALNISRNVSDWRALAGNAIRSSVLTLRHKLPNPEKDIHTLSICLTRLRGPNTNAPTDMEVALLRQLARHHSALGNTLQARQFLDEIVDKLNAFERRILDESTGVKSFSDFPSIQQTLATVLDSSEQAKVRDAGMVDYTILSRFERSVINELLDMINSDMRHFGSKQQVSISRLAVSTVLHDQKGRIDRLLGELHKRYNAEFGNESDIRHRVLNHLSSLADQVRADFDAGLKHFAPRATVEQRSQRADAISIAQAFQIALERVRFRSRYPNIDFELPSPNTCNFGIAIDADLLITVLDNLLQNAATAVTLYSLTDHRIKVSWEWREHAAAFSPSAYIHVEDSGGAVNQLRLGLNNDDNGRYGLRLAKIFFDALRGELFVGGVEKITTILSIKLQASEIVRLL